MENLLEIQHMKKSYGEKVVLKDISFNVPSGSIVAFIGDNGAGKSTTFKSVLGLTSKDEGIVKVLGEDTVHNAKVKEEIGVVFDAMNLPAHLTIKQINKVYKKLFRAWDEDNFYRLIRNFNLPLSDKISKFSRGMSMKLSVAVALSHHARLLILDEATGGLDPSSREELLDELMNFVKEQDRGILLSSHIMSDIEKIADHLVIIKDGRILLNEKKATVFKQYIIVDVNEEQLPLIDNELIVAKRSQGSNYRVLVSNKKALPGSLLSQELTMDDLSLILTRSES